MSLGSTFSKFISRGATFVQGSRTAPTSQERRLGMAQPQGAHNQRTIGAPAEHCKRGRLHRRRTASLQRTHRNAPHTHRARRATQTNTHRSPTADRTAAHHVANIYVPPSLVIVAHAFIKVSLSQAMVVCFIFLLCCLRSSFATHLLPVFTCPSPIPVTSPRPLFSFPCPHPAVPQLLFYSFGHLQCHLSFCRAHFRPVSRIMTPPFVCTSNSTTPARTLVHGPLFSYENVSPKSNPQATTHTKHKIIYSLGELFSSLSIFTNVLA